MDGKRRVVPRALDDPGFTSLRRGIRLAVVSGAAVVFLVGIWAWLLARPAAPGGASPLPVTQSAAPAVDVDSPDTALAVRTPLPAVARVTLASQVVARNFPLVALTSAPARADAPVRAAPASSREVAAVPRILTPAEVASSSRMNLAGPQPAGAPAEGTSRGGAATSLWASARGGPHSSFFARQQGGEVGYEPEDAACIVRATSAIAARLVTHVDSELPGGVVKAQVVAPVDCADGDEAIPAGAVLQGTYDSATVAGESRLLVVFTRIIFPPSAGHPNGRAYAMRRSRRPTASAAAGCPGPSTRTPDASSGKRFCTRCSARRVRPWAARRRPAR